MSERDNASGCPPGFLTRAEVARRLGISQSSVRRLEEKLRPVVDEKGWHRFDPRKVQAHLDSSSPALERRKRARSRTPSDAVSPEGDGRHDARLFRLFEANRSHAAVVMETGLPSQVVRRAYLEWRSGYRPPPESKSVDRAAADPAAEEAAEWRWFEEGCRALTADLDESNPVSRPRPRSIPRFRFRQR